jgi:hypothetical protein
VPVPKRLGIAVKPKFIGLILVSNQARIMRPEAKAAARIYGLESVVKVERLIDTIYQSFEQRPAAMVKLVSTTELEALGRRLAELHVPSNVDWAGKFGIRAQTQAPANPHPQPSVRPACINCGRRVSDAVIAFCHSRPVQFSGAVYCVDCQVPFVMARP